MADPQSSENLLPPCQPLAAIIEALTLDAALRREAMEAGRPLGPVTGLRKLDALVSGSLMPGLHILHGSPGSTKSALALTMASQCQAPALFVSCEMGAVEVLRRLIARHTGTYLNRLKTGELTAGAVQDLATKTASTFPLLGIMDATAKPAPIVHIAEAITSLRESPAGQQARAPGAFVVVDSAHTWAARAFPEMEEYQRLAFALDKMEELAQSQRIPLLLIAERSKAATKGGQGAAAGHRRFEYSGETVLEIDCKEEKGQDDWQECLLTISKNRHGSCGRIPLRWQGKTQRHEETR